MFIKFEHEEKIINLNQVTTITKNGWVIEFKLGEGGIDVVFTSDDECDLNYIKVTALLRDLSLLTTLKR